MERMKSRGFIEKPLDFNILFSLIEERQDTKHIKQKHPHK
jgi:hypothetical protein